MIPGEEGVELFVGLEHVIARDVIQRRHGTQTPSTHLLVKGLMTATMHSRLINVFGSAAHCHLHPYCFTPSAAGVPRQASVFATPIGQDIPFGPMPQYPIGFLCRYCWW